MSMQSASQHGNHNIIVQAHGETSNIALGLAHLNWSRLLRVLEDSLAARLTSSSGFPSGSLVGRDDDMQFFKNGFI